MTISGQTGTVKEIRLMHLHIVSEDQKKDILIPNSVVLSQVILKNRPGEQEKPIKTTLILDQPPKTTYIGDEVLFTGKLEETEGGVPHAGAIINVFDQDIGHDDWLAEGVTDAEGKFRIKWIARKVDAFDDNAEVYAKFDGDIDHRTVNSKTWIIEVKDK